jgi:hypothetical protein
MNRIVNLKGNRAERHACASSNICRMAYAITVLTPVGAKKKFTTIHSAHSQAPEAWILIHTHTHPSVYPPSVYFFSEMCDFQIYVTLLNLCNCFTLFVSFRDRSYIIVGTDRF